MVKVLMCGCVGYTHLHAMILGVYFAGNLCSGCDESISKDDSVCNCDCRASTCGCACPNEVSAGCNTSGGDHQCMHVDSAPSCCEETPSYKDAEYVP